MEDIKEQVKKDVDKIREEKLKKSFEVQRNKSFSETLKDLKIGIDKYNNSINSHIDDLDKKFNEKWNKKFNELSKIDLLKNQNNNNMNIIHKNVNLNNNPGNNRINNNINNFNDNDLNRNKNNFIIINNNDNVHEDDEELRKKEIDIDNLNKPTLVYLTLLQNTNPLINIILQCLSNIKYIVCYYLNPIKENKILKKSKENPNNNYLGPSFLKLLDHLWKSNQKEYSPMEIHNVLQKIMLNNYYTNDASIIINNILTKLNEELNFNQENNNIEHDDPYDYFIKDKIYEKFKEKFKNNRTMISEVFYCAIKIKKRCFNCNATAYYFETSPIVNIYLEENKDDNFNKLSFEEHFHNLLTDKEEQNINEDCTICCSKQNKTQVKDIFTSSKILIININREKDPEKTISFKYPEIFDGKKIINLDCPNISNYKLTTIIKKIKRNNNNFEYISFYENIIDKHWYSFNNQRIELIQNDYKNYIFDEKNTIVLIYTQIQ